MNITALRRIWFSISAALLIASLGLVATLGLNLGLDFTGGARWDVQFSEPTTAEALNDFSLQRPQTDDIRKAPDQVEDWLKTRLPQLKKSKT